MILIGHIRDQSIAGVAQLVAGEIGFLSSRIALLLTCSIHRKTAGVMFADRAGAGILRWMGWDEQQAFAYTWAAREMIHPQELDGSQTPQLQPSVELINFSSPKERTRSCDD